MKSEKREMTPILFNTRDELIKVDIDKMVYAMAEDNYVYMHFRNGQTVMVCLTLQRLEALIAGTMGTERTNVFIRIGRKYIVNSQYVMAINVLKQQLVLSDMEHLKPITLPASREALKSLKETFTKNIY